MEVIIRTYISMDFGGNGRPRLINYSINFFDNVEICLVVGVFHPRSPPRNVGQLASR